MILLLAGLLLLHSCGDDVTSHYKTRADAEADRLFDRGWLPDIIPPSSRDITTSNDLDLNQSRGSFAFDPADSEAFIKHLSQDKEDTFTYHEGNSHWVFEIDRENGRCEYTMRLQR